MHSSYAATNLRAKGENNKPFFCRRDGRASERVKEGEKTTTKK